MPHTLRLTGFLVISALLIISMVGCSASREAARKTADMLRKNNELQIKNSQLAAELAEQNAVTARLQMELVEKQAEINRNKSTQERLSQQAVYNKIRMRMPSPSTKAEAVTYLAEVETDINAARELASDNEHHVFVEADRLIAESKTEFEQGDYDKAGSLASRAMELIRAIGSKTAPRARMKRSVYADFIAPVHLQVAKRSNLRKTPGIHGKILDTLDAKSSVTATGYRGNWIKVTSQNGQIGWIYSTLLSVNGSTPPSPAPAR